MKERSKIISDTKAGAHPGIDSFIRGKSKLLMSSIDLGWKHIALEFHEAFVGMKDGSVSPDHLVALFTDQVTRGEISPSKGRFIRRAYQHGAMNLFPSGPIPACRLFTPAKLIVCALSPDFVKDVGQELGTMPTTESGHTLDLHDHILRGIVLLLSAETNAGGLTGKLYVDHLAHALAIRYLWLTGGKRTNSASRLGRMPARALNRVLDRMKADLSSNINLNSLAAESGYSRSHFLRMFRADMGCSPHQWLTRLRVDQAKTMLRQDGFSLLDIALACGFANNSHFANRFSEIVGVSPSSYRRQFR